MSSTGETAPSPDGSSNNTSPVPPPASSSPPPPPPPPPPESSPPPLSPSSPTPPPPQSSFPPPPPPKDSQHSPPPPSPSRSSGTSPPPPSFKSNNSPIFKSSPLSPPPPPTGSYRAPTLAWSPPPPPPPPRTKTPSSPSRSHKASSSTPSPRNSDSDVALEIGVGIAAALFVLTLVALISICCMMSKKKKREPYYYGDTKGDYYNGGNWHHGASPSPPMDHMMQGGGGGGMIPPPPASVAWWPPPPQPMMMNNSCEMPSSNFSGPRPTPLPPPSPIIALGFTKSTFSYEELAHATDDFSRASILGQGGFGYVYKGVLQNGKEIAVKQLKSGSGQGGREFQAEVEIISRVHHRHLVSLVGYCIAGTQRMLVYEFVPNSTLEYHLHGKGRPTMDWPTRLKIALGSAKGLAYLHEDCHPRIIHRDIKAANILLDHKFEAQVADFGLAKLSEDTHTHVSTRVMGTFGYLAPEYASSGKLTEKSDVFSFGVMLLELITGRKPVDPTGMEDSLVEWARPLLQKAMEQGDYSELVDERLESNYNPEEMARLVACAGGSVRHSARRRPRMSQIVRALEGDMSLVSFNEGLQRGQGSMTSSNYTAEYDTTAYNRDMSKFRRMAFESGDLESMEYSQPMSQHGGNTSGSSGEFSRDMEPASLRRNLLKP